MTKQEVDMDYMCTLYNFYINDLTIKKYSDYIRSHVFNNGWVVVFNDHIIQLFDFPNIKNYMENIFDECLTHLRLYGLFVYWVRKDISEWIDWYTEELKNQGDIILN